MPKSISFGASKFPEKKESVAQIGTQSDLVQKNDNTVNKKQEPNIPIGQNWGDKHSFDRDAIVSKVNESSIFNKASESVVPDEDVPL